MNTTYYNNKSDNINNIKLTECELKLLIEIGGGTVSKEINKCNFIVVPTHYSIFEIIFFINKTLFINQNMNKIIHNEQLLSKVEQLFKQWIFITEEYVLTCFKNKSRESIYQNTYFYKDLQYELNLLQKLPIFDCIKNDQEEHYNNICIVMQRFNEKILCLTFDMQFILLNQDKFKSSISNIKTTNYGAQFAGRCVRLKKKYNSDIERNRDILEGLLNVIKKEHVIEINALKTKYYTLLHEYNEMVSNQYDNKNL